MFYLFVVLLQIRLTSPPIPCFILLASAYTGGFDILCMTGQFVPAYETKEGHIRWQDLRIAHVFYAIFNLDFFLSALPPFCISSKLKFFHVVLFGYISVFYPILLILLTWLCVELYGRNNKLLIWLWKPFKICLARLKKRGIETKSDLVDVFATFFLLSYNKCIKQTQRYYITGCSFVINIDPSGNHSSIHRLSLDGNYTILYDCFLVSFLFISAFFCLLPLTLLICYPFRFFRTCLSKCHLDFLAVSTFVENFHGHYRNGLDGGRDMRSLSGLYFILEIVANFILGLSVCVIKDYSFYYSGVASLTVALTIALVRPYKKAYANILDTLILVDLVLIRFYNYYNNGSSLYVWLIYPRILTDAPMVLFIAVLLFKMIYKVFQVCNIQASPSQCYKHLCGRTHEEVSESSALIATATCRAEQPLISPMVPASN